MKTKATIFFSVLITFFIFQSSNAQTWELVGLDSMVIRQLYVFGDTIYAGTAVRNGININAGLYYSTNKGTSWVQLDSALGNGSITDIEFYYGNRDTFYLVKGESPSSMGGKLYKTSNGGTSWQIISDLEDKYINWFEISSFNWNELYALERINFPAGQLESLYRSMDAGESWEEIGSFPSDSHGNYVTVALDLVNDFIIYVAVGTQLSGDYFYQSTDKGNTWTYISEPPNPMDIADMYTSDYEVDRIYMNTSYVSYNSGYNWAEIDSGFLQNSYYLSHYQDIKKTNLLFNLRTDGIYTSQRDSFFWEILESSETLPLNYGIGGFSTSDLGLMKNVTIDNVLNKIYVGTGYGIYGHDYASEVNDLQYSAVVNFILEQNYPNPFNPATTISYQLPEKSFITLKVYDVLGNEIKTLVAEEKHSGKYQIEFNGSELTSGVYFYVLSAVTESGERIREGGKMLLLK